MLAAFTTNTMTKMVFAVTAGGRLFALYVIPGLMLMLAAAWAGAFIAGPSLLTSRWHQDGWTSICRARSDRPAVLATWSVRTPFEKLAEMPLRSASDGSVNARVKLP